ADLPPRDRLVDILREVLECPACLRPDEFSKACGIATELLNDESRKVRVGPQEVDVGRDDGRELVVDRHLALDDVDDFGDDLQGGHSKDGLEQLVLAAIVIVQHGLVDAGALCDLLHACPIVSLLVEHVPCGLEDALFCVDRFGHAVARFTLESIYMVYPYGSTAWLIFP